MSYQQIEYLSEEEIEVLHQLFDFLDKDAEGKIKVKELIDELRRFDLDKSNPTIFEMITLLDANNTIDFSEFINGINTKFCKSSSKENLKKIFDIFDKSKCGFIPLKSLKELSEEIGDTIIKSEFDDLIKEVTDSTSLSFDFFCEIIDNQDHSMTE